MSPEQERVAERQEVFGQALCWLRLVRGIPSLRAADRLYRERVRPEAAESEFASLISRYERGLVQARQQSLIEILTTYGCDFRDLETSLEVMMLGAKTDLAGVRVGLEQDSTLRERVEALVDPVDEGQSRLEFVLGATEEALER